MTTAASASHNGISWYFTNTVTSGSYINGEPWVVGSINGGVTVSSITPQVVLGPATPRTQSGYPYSYPNSPSLLVRHNDLNGSMVDPCEYNPTQLVSGSIFQTNIFSWIPPGSDNKIWCQGFHGSATVHNTGSIYDPEYGYSWGHYVRENNFAARETSPGVWAPLNATNTRVLKTGESLVSCESSACTFLYTAARTSIIRQGVLTCVSQAPQASSFRPPATLRGLANKENVYNASDIDYTKLASFDMTTFSSTTMASATIVPWLLSALKYPEFTHMENGDARHINTGYYNTLGSNYGQSIAAAQNYAMGYINTNMLSQANKVTLTNYLVQRAIDIVGSVLQSLAYPDGNYGQFPSQIMIDHVGGGGGQNGSRLACILFFYSLLKPGAKKDAVRAILDLINYHSENIRPLYSDNGQLYEVNSNFLNKIYPADFFNLYPQYLTVSTALTYQTSDLYSVNWAMKHEGPLSSTDGLRVRKNWMEYDLSSIMSGIPGYNISHLNYIKTEDYRRCCTAAVWPGMIFAFKAMGAEKDLLYSTPYMNRYYQMFLRREKYYPYANYPNYDNFNTLDFGSSFELPDANGQYVSLVDFKHTPFVQALSAFSVPSVIDQTPNTRGFSILAQGVESIGFPTTSSVYIECSAPFVPGSNVVVRCHGMSSFSPGDYMTLFAVEEQYWSSKTLDIIGLKSYIQRPQFSYSFTLPAGSNIASVVVPVSSANAGNTYVLQAFLVTTNSPYLYSTNALRVTIR